MRVVIQSWDGDAAVKLSPKVLAAAGIRIGQSLKLEVAPRELVLSSNANELDALLAQITPENRHGPALEGGRAPVETW